MTSGFICHDEPDEPCPCAPTVDKVEIVPSEVFVPQGEVFELRARLRAPNGSVIPESFGYRPAWESLNRERLEVVDRVGHSVVLQARGGPGDPKEVPIRVTVEAVKGVSGTATVTVTNTSLFTDDRIERVSHPRGPPAIALLEGSGTMPRSTVAFVRTVEVGNLTAGEVGLFSGDLEVGIDAATFSPSQDNVPFTGLKAPLEIPVTIWLPDFAVNDDWTAITIQGVVGNDVADAMRTFALNRVGLTLKVTTRSYSRDDPLDSRCGGARPGSVAGSLNVYYVPEMDETGISCVSAGGNDILISLADELATTLVHELGHALSLGHTDYENTFDGKPDNVMKAASYNRPDARAHFSLGQAFRMNRDARSWLFAAIPVLRPAASSRNCDPVLKANGCPSLDHDVP
jgi:hypothetical protein